MSVDFDGVTSDEQERIDNSQQHNYADLFSGATQEWVNHISKSYVNLVGPDIQIFKMDKVKTKLDELYGESRQGRIYLPPFKIKALYDNNKWIGFLDAGGYQEQEEVLFLFLNFEDMIEKVTGLKKKKVSELYITYEGNGSPSIEKKDNNLIIYTNDVELLNYDLTNSSYSTVRKLANELNNEIGFSCTIKGKNDLSINIINFERMNFNQRDIMIYTLDDTYQNITDIIEMGDCILTNHYRLYEVTSSVPAGDFGWEYSLWRLGLELASPDRFNLPGNYVSMIKERQHGLQKINME